MANPVTIGSILEVRVGYKVNDQQCYAVLHYQTVVTDLGLNQADVMEEMLGTLGGAGNGTFIGEFADVMSGDAVLNSCAFQMIYPTRYKSKIETFTTTGTVAGACPAQNVQGSITKRGDIADRHNTGGLRIGGLSSSNYSGGSINAGQKTLYETLILFLAEDIQNGAGTVVFSPAIANKVLTVIDGDDHWVLYGSTPVTTWAVEPQLRTQRSRTKGYGI